LRIPSSPPVSTTSPSAYAGSSFQSTVDSVLLPRNLASVIRRQRFWYPVRLATRTGRMHLSSIVSSAPTTARIPYSFAVACRRGEP
jgi:hypothetical protein